MSSYRKRQESKNKNNRSILTNFEDMLKALAKEMMTPLDGKPINWWLNGFAAIILILLFIGIISYGG